MSPPKKRPSGAGTSASRTAAQHRRAPISIVALDVGSAHAAVALMDRLGDRCQFYKIGSELFAAAGPAMVEFTRARGSDVFLDLKLHDIPNTVGRAAEQLARLGARLITVHASGGRKMVEAAVAGAGEGSAAGGGRSRCEVFAVSVLTSLDSAELGAVWGRKIKAIETEVLRLADLAARAGAAGIVCGGREIKAVRERFGGRLQILVPGVRPRGVARGDQARTVTPEDAARLGADYVVLGRAVTAASDARAALARVTELLGAGG